MFAQFVILSGLSNMAYWKKGKVFRKGGKMVRYIYKNGSKRNRRLTTVSKWRRKWSPRKKVNYRRRRY